MVKFRSTAVADTLPPPPPPKRARTNLPTYFDISDNENNHSEGQGVDGLNNFAHQADAEWQMYLLHKVVKGKMDVVCALNEGEFDAMTWCKHVGATEFPILARVARSILCVPDSSAMSENNYSDAGNTISQKRNCRKPSVVNDLMFYRSNGDLCK